MSATGPEDVEIVIPGLRLAARVWGPRSAPPVLCLHGWLDNAATFDRLLPLLSGRCFVALDLAGHGRSEHRGPGGTYGFLDTCADAALAVHALGWSRFGLLGHSMGAAVAATLAGTYPERVDELVCIEGLGPMSDEPEQLPAQFAKALADQIGKADKKPVVHRSIDDAIARLGVSIARLSPEAARILCTRGLVEVDDPATGTRGVTWRTDPRLRWGSRARLTEAQVLAFLRAIRCPALLVRATGGLPVATPAMQARLAEVAGLEYVEIAGSHHVHLETPEPVADAIRSFHARCDAAPESG